MPGTKKVGQTFLSVPLVSPQVRSGWLGLLPDVRRVFRERIFLIFAERSGRLEMVFVDETI
jgi:hypothetical protein